PFIVRVGNRLLDDRSVGGENRDKEVPGSNRAGFGGENEQTGEAGSSEEVGGPVEDDTGRPAWDGDDQREGLTSAIIDGRDIRMVVCDPEGSRKGSRTKGESPRIGQVRVEMIGESIDIGHQIMLLVEFLLATSRRRRSKSQSQGQYACEGEH